MKPWSLKQAIQSRVDLEDLQRWGKAKIDTKLPAYVKIKPKKGIVQWVIFFRTCVYQFRP